MAVACPNTGASKRSATSADLSTLGAFGNSLAGAAAAPYPPNSCDESACFGRKAVRTASVAPVVTSTTETLSVALNPNERSGAASKVLKSKASSNPAEAASGDGCCSASVSNPADAATARNAEGGTGMRVAADGIVARVTVAAGAIGNRELAGPTDGLGAENAADVAPGLDATTGELAGLATGFTGALKG